MTCTRPQAKRQKPLATRASSTHDHKVDFTVDHKRSGGLQRMEVITGVGRRRKWPADFKAQVVAESLEPSVVISEVARRHGLRPQQLFTWRNQMRSAGALAGMPLAPSRAAKTEARPAETLQFAAVVTEPVMSRPNGMPEPHSECGNENLIEIVYESVVVRVRGATDAKTLTAVLLSLKAVL